MIIFPILLYLIFCVGIPVGIAWLILSLQQSAYDKRIARLEREIRRLTEASSGTHQADAPTATEPPPLPATCIPPQETISQAPTPQPETPCVPPELPPLGSTVVESTPEQARPVQPTPSDSDFPVQKLREWKVLPPENMPMEVVLMQWWLPRIGGVLALLAMIFFGLWAAQFSSPLVKVLEMAGVACAVTGIGLFFRKRENPAVGDPLTATGTTMFYLVALAAGTFEPTKIFDSVPVALGAQLLAILPTVLLSRGRPIPLLLGLAFAFVSAMFAVLSGSGVAALLTAFLAYATAAILGEKKNSIGLFITGTVGAYLPLWFMDFHSRSDADASAWTQPDFLACLAFFAACVILANITYFRMKNLSTTARLIFGGNITHAFSAMIAATAYLERASQSHATENYAPLFALGAVIFLASAVVYFLAWRKNSFAYQLSLNVGATAAFAAVVAWFGISNDGVFYGALAEAFLLAVISRSTGARWSLVSILALLFIAPISLIGYEQPLPTEYGIYIAVSAGTLALFFGNREQWSKSESVSIWLKRAVSAGAGIYLGANAFGCWFPDSPNAIFAIGVLAAGATFIPKISRDVLLWLAATASFLVFANAVVETFFEISPPAVSPWVAPSVALTLVAIPALRIFIKNEKLGSALEIAYTAPTLLCVSNILAQKSPKIALVPAVILFALPLAALALGVRWKKDSSVFPLMRRSADLAALPLLVALFGFTWSRSVGFADARIAVPTAVEDTVVTLLLACVFLPFFVKPLRELLRERPWITASLTIAGTACLLAWGYALFPDTMTTLMAILSLGLIFSGLRAKIGIARFIGIALLAGTLVRLFVFDIEETIWRIVAFAAVSLVLFTIGYFYHRWMQRDDTPPAR